LFGKNKMDQTPQLSDWVNNEFLYLKEVVIDKKEERGKQIAIEK